MDDLLACNFRLFAIFLGRCILHIDFFLKVKVKYIRRWILFCYLNIAFPWMSVQFVIFITYVLGSVFVKYDGASDLEVLVKI